MAAQAGWYPDPAGDRSKLRFWDGSSWTDNYMDAPAQVAEEVAAAQPQPQQQASYSYDQQYQQAPGAGQVPPVYAQATVVNVPMYAVSRDDQMLRLVAFIFALVSTISCGFLIVPLAWMVPMTVISWRIYKGRRANTMGFAICSLIFLNIVTGILLIISTHER